MRAGEQPNTFVLSNIKWADKAAGSATGTSGTAAPAAAGSSLKLVGAGASQLTEHIGKTVEVTGTLDKSPSAAAPPAGEPAAAKKDEPTLNVRTAKMVSSSCESK